MVVTNAYVLNSEASEHDAAFALVKELLRRADAKKIESSKAKSVGTTAPVTTIVFVEFVSM
jgi:hypothetical protein